MWRLAERHALAQRLPPDFAIQGEVCGPGIQKNRLGLPGVELFVFSVYDVRAARFLDYEAFVAFCAEHGLPTVPVERVVRGDDAAAYRHDLDGWLEAARGVYPNGKQRKEGIVVRPLVEDAVGDARRPAVVQGDQQRLPAQGRGLGHEDELSCSARARSR